MNLLAKNIEYLLLSHNCVIVPSLGAFSTSLSPARWVEGESLFLPPVRYVHFDATVTSDPQSLFVHALERIYHISFDEASFRCEEMLADFHRALVTEGSVDFGSIGVFSLEDDAQITMASCECGILTPDYYGLDALHFKRLCDRKQPSKIIPLITPEHEAHLHPTKGNGEIAAAAPAPIETRHFVIRIRKTLFRYACFILFAVMAFYLIKPTPIEYGYDSHMIKAQMFLQPEMVVGEESHAEWEEIQTVMGDTTFIDATLTDVTIEIADEGYDFDTQDTITTLPVETGATTETKLTTASDRAEVTSYKVEAISQKTKAAQQKKEAAPKATPTKDKVQPYEAPTGSYGIVLASQVSRANAEEYIVKLRARHINATLIESAKIRRIVITGYTTQKAAHEALAALKAAHADMESAWILNLE